MGINEFIFNVAKSAPGLLFAIIVHEWAHGYMAKRFGDLTAEREGRLTFNPAAHIDLVGTIIIPLVCIKLGGFAFGWAKPVPVDTRNFSNIRKGIFWVSFAGPLANFITGVLSAFFYILISKYAPESGFKVPIEEMLKFSIVINFILMGFNLIPLPPLDGSKMVAVFLKGEALRKYEGIAQFTPMIFIAAFGLSMVGIHTFGYLILPFIWASNFIINVFGMIL